MHNENLIWQGFSGLAESLDSILNHITCDGSLVIQLWTPPKISALTVEAVLMFFWRILKSAPLLTSLLDNTAGIVARRSTFTRKDRTRYLLPVVVTDSGSPALFSTSTLTISVCSCQPAGHCPTGGVKALPLPMRVSLQTLLGLAVCLVTLAGKHPWRAQLVLHPVFAQNINLWYTVIRMYIKECTLFFGVWSLGALCLWAAKLFQGLPSKRENEGCKTSSFKLKFNMGSQKW